MTLKSSEVRVAGTGELFLAPVGTAAPTDTATALPAAWVGYGYTTEDGVVLSKSVEREGVAAWQSTTPVRYITTGQEFTVQTTLLQSNEDTVALWLGSGAFGTTGTTEFKADMPIDPVTQQFALIVEWSDGGIVSRLHIPKAEVTETGDVNLARQATGFPVTFGAIAPDTGTVLASWFTSDANFATGALGDDEGPQDDQQPDDLADTQELVSVGATDPQGPPPDAQGRTGGTDPYNTPTPTPSQV